MSLNETPSAERIQIGFFGVRNAGKSSLVNAITSQKLSIVSDVLGTTTDPVKKSMELLPLGAVTIIDTPGIDDEGKLGKERANKAKEFISKVHFAVIVVDAKKGLQEADKELISIFQNKNIPYITAYNKCDLLNEIPNENDNVIYLSAEKNININLLKEKISKTIVNKDKIGLLDGLVEKNDIIVLVTPIDESAPKGRMILPQQQTIRAVLDKGAINIVTKETELKQTLEALSVKPKLVITDSQAFEYVSTIVPNDIMLTSFSMLFARYKGDLKILSNGALTLDLLKDGDKVLISEGCTHHRQCNDIGTVKLPNWILKYTNKKLDFSFTSGDSFKDDLKEFALVVHCGGCMLNEREMKSRIKLAVENNVPITNYGTLIAHINGILKRALEPFEGSINT